MQRSRITALALVVVALGAVAAVVLPELRTPTFHGTDLGPTAPSMAFTLQAADRGDVSLSDFRGKAVLLFFGYTSCPDVCPTTMARLDEVMQHLGDRRSEVQVVLVTVDPEVDTPARLREYVQRFDLGFVGLGGDRQALADVAADFGAWAGEPEAPASPDSAGSSHDGHAGHGAGAATVPRMIAHTPHVFGLDRDGRFRVLWNPDHTVEQIAADVRGLLRL